MCCWFKPFWRRLWARATKSLSRASSSFKGTMRRWLQALLEAVVGACHQQA
eukprot:NODE_13983_length_1135_cov_5.591270.p8 GENE.NODE_13983_length_1135_cov_5.591270~~NODE_13983_length_1135_cov_5.591270.p8  ORF type:complete len:51 (+),score=3.76 NODE_13983_length_1135_cov_5.591270:162-314(+)